MGASARPAPLVLGPYELVPRLATGGMAEVYLARRAGPFGFQKRVAVKRILPQLASDPDFVSMFIDEARLSARLSHPNIVQVFDFGEQDGELYMAMEYIDGTNAARLIRAAALHDSEIPIDVCMHVALSVLRALDHAHSVKDDEGKPLALVHRDVSPGNVLIDKSGAVKLTDFGIARAAEFERRTDVGQLKGKLGYMSPEQVTGRDLDPRSDIFTAAIVLAELVMRRPLFAGGIEIDVLMRIRDADLGQIDRSGDRVPDDLKAVLLRALARDRGQRFPSAAAFVDALEELIRRRRLPVGPATLAAMVSKLDDLPPGTPEAPTGPSTALSSSPCWAAEASSIHEVAPAIYRIRMGDGAEIGPVSYPRLVEMLVTGKLDPGTTLAREKGPFKELKSFTELGRFAVSSAFRWEADGMPRAATTRGPLDRRTLPSRLFSIAWNRETGALYLANGARRKRIYFVEGVPEFVTSTEKAELLGEQLVARGQVLRMEVDMALAMLPKFGGRIGDALVGLGVLRPVELFRAIASQTQDRFLEVFAWDEGEIGFVAGARSHEETFPLGLDPFQLVARGVREKYSAEEILRMTEALDREALAPVLPLPVRLESFRFQHREERAIKRVDGVLPLAAIVRALDAERVATPDETRRAIFLALSCDLVRSPGWSSLPT